MKWDGRASFYIRYINMWWGILDNCPMEEALEKDFVLNKFHISRHIWNKSEFIFKLEIKKYLTDWKHFLKFQKTEFVILKNKLSRRISDCKCISLPSYPWLLYLAPNMSWHGCVDFINFIQLFIWFFVKLLTSIYWNQNHWKGRGAW